MTENTKKAPVKKKKGKTVMEKVMKLLEGYSYKDIVQFAEQIKVNAAALCKVPKS